MRYLAAISLLAASGVAHAQGSTTCSTIGNVTNCQHQQPSQVPDYLGAMRAAQASVPSYEDSRLKRAQADALEARARSEQESISCRKKAMKAIDAGEYEKAKALASLCP